MNNFWDKLRNLDLNGYLHLYNFAERNNSWELFFYFFARFGIVFFFFSFTYLIWKKKINAFFSSFLAMALAGVVDLLISIFWGRPSPFITHFDLVSPVTTNLRVAENDSFPSSHTYIVFAIAISVYLYGHKKLGITLFLLAILVAISRVGAGLNYPSDVVGGAILGLISGTLAFLIVKRAEKNWRY